MATASEKTDDAFKPIYYGKHSLELDFIKAIGVLDLVGDAHG